MAELKPCPFCGGKAHKCFSVYSEGYRYGCFTVNCMANLYNQLISFETDEEAIKAWNTRTQKEGE